MSNDVASIMVYAGGAVFAAAVGWWSWRDVKRARNERRFKVPLFGSVTQERSPGFFGSLLALRSITFWMAIPMVLLLVFMLMTS